MRVVWWGIYDLSMTRRTRILMDGLTAAGVEVSEIHAPIWDDVENKALMPWHGVLRRFARLLLAYPRLIRRYLAAPDHDAVIVGCLGHLDILVLWPFARLRRKPVIWDNFISLYSTVVENRKLVGPFHPVALAIKLLEAVASRSVDRVVLDTRAHAAYFAQLYGLPEDRLGAVFLGAERLFARQPDSPSREDKRKRPHILFYGKFAPTHGLDVIVDAAMSERGRAFDWTIVGTGQAAGTIDRRLQSLALPYVQRVDWIAYEDLPKAIADADVCLGMFGTGGKSGVALPNKVFQVLAGGQRLVTRDSLAIRELVTGEERHVALVAPDDPQALLDGIDKVLSASVEPREHANILARIMPEAIGRCLLEEIETVIAKTAAPKSAAPISEGCP